MTYTKPRQRVALLVVLTLALSCEAYAQRNVNVSTWKGREIQHRPSEIALKLQEDVSPEQASSLIIQHDASVKRSFDKLGWGGVIDISKEVDIFSVIRKLERSPLDCCS